MGINYESRQIGSVRPTHISGEEIIGASQLRFSLAWLLFPKRADEVFTVSGTSIWVSVLVDGGGSPLMVGQAMPETAWCEESREGQPYESHVMYRLTLPHGQLLALEEARRGRGLTFVLQVRGNSSGAYGVRSIDDSLQFPVNASDWSRVLKEANAAETLLVGVQLPTDTSVPGTRAALDLVRKANEHLVFGHYDAAVAECRRAIDSVWALGKLTKDAVAARKSMATGNEQRRMTKRDRELALGEALRNFCHSAHHVGDDAEPEIFSRTDAALMVAGTAGLVSSLIASPDWIKPNDEIEPAKPVTQPEKPEVVVVSVPKVQKASSPVPLQSDSSLSAQVVKVRQHLQSHPSNRPRTIKTLRSALESLFAKKLTVSQLDALITELVKQKIVTESGGKLSYPQAKK
jgi:hypothetical protein